MADSEGVLPVSEKDWEVAFSVPAPAVNRFTAFITPLGIRIAFQEMGMAGTVPQIRSAVTMSWDDALSLANLLQSLITAEIKKLEDQHPTIGGGGETNG